MIKNTRSLQFPLCFSIPDDYGVTETLCVSYSKLTYKGSRISPSPETRTQYTINEILYLFEIKNYSIAIRLKDVKNVYEDLIMSIKDLTV